MQRIILGLAVLLLLAGCDEHPEEKADVMFSAKGPALKVIIHADGSLTADGEPITFDALRARIKQLKQENGKVWLFSEDAALDPYASSLKVMEMIATERVPTTVSTSSEFTDLEAKYGKSPAP